MEFTDVAGNSAANEKIVLSYKKADDGSRERNKKVSKRGPVYEDQEKQDKSEGSKSDKKQPGYYGPKKDRTNQPKSSTRGGTTDKTYEGSNGDSTTKRDNGSKESKPDNKVERNEGSKDSSNEKSPREIK